MKAKKHVIAVIEQLAETLEDQPFEAQNMDCLVALHKHGMGDMDHPESLAEALKQGFTGSSTRIGRDLTRSLSELRAQ